MRFHVAFAVALLLAVGLAACSGGSSSPSGRVCPLPTGATPQLLYPVSGTTQVPDDVGILIYQGYAGESTVTLANGVLAPIATTPTSLPTTLPSPIATPSNPNGTTYAVSVPTLAAASIYSVLYALPAGCTPSTAQFGYFTTQ